MGVLGSTFGGQVVWSIVSQFEVAEGVLVVSAVLFFLAAGDYFRPGTLIGHPILRRRVASPLSRLCLVFAVLGAVSFDLLVLCNFQRLDRVIDINGWDLVRYPLTAFGYLGGRAFGAGGRLGYGALALLVWGFTLTALSLGAGFTRATKLFALPSILFLSMVVFLFDPRQMDMQAINIMSGVTLDGVSLLSNWSLLTISSCLTVMTLAHGRLERSSRYPGESDRLPRGL